MVRSLSVVLLVATLALCVEYTPAATNDHAAMAAANEVAEIYKKFLNDWTEIGKTSSVNVAKMAQTPSPEDIKSFSICARKGATSNSQWLPAKGIDDLGDIVGKLPYVHLVDLKEWKPDDPEDLASQKQSIESAVNASFAHGLMTVSAITFDESDKTAAFTYSFVCGSLCGSGGTVIFRRMPGGWIQSKQQCGGWVS